MAKREEKSMEEKYPVLQGAEPFFVQGNNIGVLVQHGFTGTTQSMRYLAEHLADRGFTVCAPRLKGHGTHYEDMENSTYEEWVHSVEEGYGKLQETCDQIFVTGLSMGGTLALYMAENHPEIAGLILINAAVNLPHLDALRGEQSVQYVDAIGSDIKAQGVQELAYEKTPVRSIKELLELTDIVRNELPSITCPALVFVSTEDHVVPPANSDLILERIESDRKRKIVLEHSYHVATLDNDKQIIVDECVSFIEETIKSLPLS
jgi:carboxylesterase